MDTDPARVLESLLRKGFQFPLIGKPDIGGRGRGVRKLEDAQALMSYASAALVDFHIQEFILFEKEAGIFYYRFPGQKKGTISGIVHKEFLKVRGDGNKTIRELLIANPRAILQLPQLEMTVQEMLDRITGGG